MQLYELLLAIAQRIAERLQGRVGRPEKSVENSTNLESGRTDELAAKGAGFGSKDTYRSAQKVVEHGTPELVAAMDEGIKELETLPGGVQSADDTMT